MDDSTVFEQRLNWNVEMIHYRNICDNIHIWLFNWIVNFSFNRFDVLFVSYKPRLPTLFTFCLCSHFQMMMPGVCKKRF